MCWSSVRGWYVCGNGCVMVGIGGCVVLVCVMIWSGMSYYGWLCFVVDLWCVVGVWVGGVGVCVLSLCVCVLSVCVCVVSVWVCVGGVCVCVLCVFSLLYTSPSTRYS